MIIAIQNSKCASINRSRVMSSESGAALATAILMLALLSAIAMTVLAVVHTESRIASSDLKRTQAFYAASAGIEKMTSDFSQLFSQTSKPTTAQLNSIAASQPPGLDDEGYTLSQTLVQDTTTLAAMRTTQGIFAPKYPSVLMPTDSPFAGLNASVNPFTLTSVARATDGTEVGLTRQMNNYMIPIFQFGVFSDNDLEFWPEPPMTFNGRVHSNGNIYFGGDCTFLAKVTTANEAVRDKLRNNAENTTLVGGAGGFTSNPRWKLTPTGTPIALTQGSVNLGPNLTPQPRSDGRGKFDGSPVGFNPSPNGTNNANWSTYSVNPFGGLLLTKSTGVKALKLPLQLSQINRQPFELIKRSTPDDSTAGLDALSNSRYQTKARIRILIDDEGVGTGASNEAGIGNDPATGLQKGVLLSSFNPVSLDSGRALRPVNDNGTYGSAVDWFQGDPARARTAETVRGVRNDYAGLIAAATASTAGGGRATATNYTANGSNASIPKAPNGAIIPPGAGIKGRILIEIVPPIAADGTQPAPIDVTTTILSMGMTVGEPNAIVMLQRPAWANFMQGSRDRKGSNMYLTYFLHNGITTDAVMATRRALADGEISLSVPFNANGFITTSLDNNLDDDPHPTATPNQFTPTASSMARDDKPFTITVGAAGAAAGATTVPVGALTQAIPSGTVLDFGGGKTARLTASAAVGATSLTVSALTTALVAGNFAQSGLNRIVPINVYNVREGRMDEALTSTNVYQRGITSVIEINMRNLARWVDGAYDTTLFNAIPAESSPKSANIEGSDGYTVYISDRRGDRVKSERNSAGSTIQTTNGNVDNEDIYNYTAATPVLEPGEDVIDDGYDVGLSSNKRGSLQLDKCELPSPAAITAVTAAKPTGAGSVTQTKFDMAAHVSRWNPVRDTSLSCAANQYWFRRGVRIFNGENLQVSGSTGKLSQTKGITIATENMMYLWGNYNTTGINAAPATGVSSLNESSSASRYNGSQVPASLVADAVFPISKTWFDALPALYPEGWTARVADAGNSSDTSTIAIGLETAVRAGVIAGSTQSAMVGTTVPTGTDYLDWLNGGVHNFPRFLEIWSVPTVREERWNYVGSFIILFSSTQAVAPWSVEGAVVYYPPIRNWAFDITFTDPNRLPPGTPQFQHVEPTGFRQIL
ncbi:MAG: hypothetical protein ABR568_11180 [Pyrinomonadaceae bacterium]